jgi:glycosyltransferase involved in cell wall biosynthesis
VPASSPAPARETGDRVNAGTAVSVSVVIPCLDEEATIAEVVRKALEGIAAAGAEGEVIVVDNGSGDRSVELAEAAGARVLHEPRRGYGSAYLAGLEAAGGEYVVMADADDTYDLTQLGQLVERLDAGADLVLGSRFRGRILPGAMPWSHRWIGNPVLTGMLNLLFRSGISDAHCGLRAVRSDVLPRLRLSTTGMEFASEMVIKAAKQGLRIDEVPIVYYPRQGESKLNSARDAWRHVRFMLVHSATFLFLIPGGLALVLGLGTLTVLALRPSLGGEEVGLSLSIVAGFVAIVGAQVVQLGLFARTYAVIYLGEQEPALERLWQRFKLEHGLALGGLVLVCGLAIALYAHFNRVSDPRLGLLGLTLVALGAQGVFGSFFLSILGLSDHAILHRRVQR